MQSTEVYSRSGWFSWLIQKYLEETALFMELCMPYLKYFLLFIPLICKVNPDLAVLMSRPC